MATEVRLDEGDGSFLVLDARVVKSVGSDFMLDSVERRKGGDYFDRRNVDRQHKQLIRQLEALGVKVTGEQVKEAV